MTVLITTSRRPTRRMRTFIKELERVIPSSKRIQRGKSSLTKLKDRMIMNGFDKLVVVEAYKGNPGRMIFYVLEEGRLKRKLIMNLMSVSMQIDVKKVFTATELKVELDENFSNDQELIRLKDFLDQFLREEIIPEEREGIRCTLRISRKDNNISLCFLNSTTGRKIRPCFTAKVIWTD